MKPENKDTLTKILTYHVIPGRVSTMDLDKMIKDGGGSYSTATVQGGSLKFTGKGKKITITDAKGGTAMITIAERLPVQRRHPGHRHRIDAQLVAFPQIARKRRHPSGCRLPLVLSALIPQGPAAQTLPRIQARSV